jgi:hypothetical protein
MPLAALASLLLMGAYLFGSGSFDSLEAGFIIASAVCAGLCIVQHWGKREPEHVVIVAAGIVFSIAYIAQSMLFLASSRVSTSSLGEAISVRSIFSLAALGAGASDIFLSLQIVLIGFIALALASLFFKGRPRICSAPDQAEGKATLSNPLTIGYAAIVCTVLFGFLRKLFGLESPVAPALPMGLGGIINIASSYVGPHLSMAAMFFALHHGDEKKAKTLTLVMFALAGYNYALFTSKLSLVLPVLFLLATQYLLKRRVLRTRTLLLLGGGFVVIYPFLNLYRTALALGVQPGELVAAIAKLYASQQDSSEFDHGVIQVALSAILGRVVGYDPLLILLQANPYPDSLLGYIMNGNLDRHLTYEILNFQDPMGYSPGFLGRLYYVSRSFSFVLVATALTVFLIAHLAKMWWRGSIRLRFMAPLLLAYCLVFFSDGIRFELFRSLVISTVMIYCFLRCAGRMRIVATRNEE